MLSAFVLQAVCGGEDPLWGYDGAPTEVLASHKDPHDVWPGVRPRLPPSIDPTEEAATGKRATLRVGNWKGSLA